MFSKNLLRNFLNPNQQEPILQKEEAALTDEGV